MVAINTKIMTLNDCYKAGRKTKKKGIMIHLTATPGIMAKDWFNRWNKSGIAKCVHYFVDDKETWQYLDDDYRGWHGGKDYANSNLIGIEGCEPAGHRYSGSTPVGYDVKRNEKYFNAMYNNQVRLAAYLCKKYGWTERDIIGHIEGGKQGIASKSADPEHLYKLHGKSMNTFRADVKKLLGGDNIVAAYKKGDKGSGVKKLQENLIKLGYDLGKYGADGSFGNDTDKAVRKFQADNKLAVDGSAGPITQAKIKELLDAKNKPKPSTDVIYRVRKAWNQPATQLGAYKDLDNAIKVVEQNKGYFVFDENGKKIEHNNNADLLARIAELEKKLEQIRKIVR